MTNRDEFMKVVKGSGKKTYEIATALGMSAQTLYNKLDNTSEFTQSEIARFKDLFPDVSNETFEQIFFAQTLADKANG